MVVTRHGSRYDAVEAPLLLMVNGVEEMLCQQQMHSYNVTESLSGRYSQSVGVAGSGSMPACIVFKNSFTVCSGMFPIARHSLEINHHRLILLRRIALISRGEADGFEISLS